MRRYKYKKETKRKAVIYRRVSTNGQNLEMQMKSDESIRNQLSEDEYIIIEEHGVSANKLSFSDRPQFEYLIELVVSGEISTIYTYDRSRFVRDFYEYMFLIELFKKYGTEVIYTTQGSSYLSMSQHKLLEGILGIGVDDEGNSISRRVKDSHSRNPSSKFGFSKSEVDSQKLYIHNDKVSKNLSMFFNEISHCEDIEQLLLTIDKYRKILKKSDEDLVRILEDPFYAALYYANDVYHEIHHVKPYILKEDYERTKNLIKKIKKEYRMVQERYYRFNVIAPLCKICLTRMKYYKGKITKAAMYKCTTKKCSVELLQTEYIDTLMLSFDNVFERINVQLYLNEMYAMVNHALKQHQRRVAKLYTQLNSLQVKLVKHLNDKEAHSIIERLELQRKTLNESEKTITKLERFRYNHKNLGSIFYNTLSLTKSEKITAINILLGCVKVDNHSVSIEVFCPKSYKEVLEGEKEHELSEYSI